VLRGAWGIGERLLSERRGDLWWCCAHDRQGVADSVGGCAAHSQQAGAGSRGVEQASAPWKLEPPPPTTRVQRQCSPCHTAVLQAVAISSVCTVNDRHAAMDTLMVTQQKRRWRRRYCGVCWVLCVVGFCVVGCCVVSCVWGCGWVL